MGQRKQIYKQTHHAREQPKPVHSEMRVEKMEQRAVLQTEDSVTLAVPGGSHLSVELQGWEFQR